MKTKVMTIVGTRPEIIKLSRVICELDKFTNHTLVHTGQNYDYELNEIFFKDLEIRKPDHFLNAVGKTTAETILGFSLMSIFKSKAFDNFFNKSNFEIGTEEILYIPDIEI